MPRKHGKAVQPKNGSKFIFVNVSYPGESRGNAVIARAIRAQATTYSHRDPTRKTRGRNKPRREKLGDCLLSRRASLASSRGQDDELDGIESGSLLSQASDQADLVSRPASRLIKAIERPVSAETGDPFDTFPVPAQPWFGWVLDYYRRIHLPPGMAVVQRSEDEGRAYMEWHMREAMSESCFFSMQLLNAATPLVTQGKLAQEVVLWLRGQVVSHLNAAIRDPGRMLTIPVLLTVASIALHERLFGDVRNALEIHGPAFSRMLALKGGVQSLQVPRIGFALIQFTNDVLSSTNSGMSTGDLLNRWAPSELRKQHPGHGSAAEQA